MADETSSPEDGRREFAASATTYSLIVAAQLLAPVLVTPFLTRALTVHEFGLSILTVVMAQVVAIVLNAGFPTAVSRLYFTTHHDSSAARALVARAVLVIVVLGCVAAALLLVAADALGLPVRLVLLGALGAVLLAVFEVDQSLMRSRRQTGAFALWTVVALVCCQLIGLLFVVAGRGATGFVTGWVVGTGLGTLGSLLVVRPLPRRTTDASRHLREGLRIGLPAAAYATVLTLLTYVDRFVLSSLHGPAASGRYQLAYTVGGASIAVLGAVNLAWAPEILRSMRTGPAFLAATTVDIALGMLVLVGAGVALAPVGVAILAPAGYERTGITVAACLLLPLGALQVLHYSRTNLLTWHGRLTALAPLSAGVAVVHLATNLVLDRNHPLTGPPTAALVSFTLLAFVLSRLARGTAEEAVPSVVWVATAASIAVGVAGAWATAAGAPFIARLLLLVAAAAVAGGLYLHRGRSAPGEVLGRSGSAPR
jgi:O-antigen/teichoic acid export membrane protein